MSSDSTGGAQPGMASEDGTGRSGGRQEHVPTQSAPGALPAGEWAGRIAEQLPAHDVLQLAGAAASGRDAVRCLRAQASAPAVRNACDIVLRELDRDVAPGYAAGLLVGAAAAVLRAHRHQSVNVVWTGPESGVTTSRLTAATVIDLIDGAHRDVLLVSYATQSEPTIAGALRGAANRGVTITLLAERHHDNPHYTGAASPFPDIPALRLHWPAGQRPPGAALHAKIIVVDEKTALVGSANLTGRAMEDNLECGILLRGGPVPKALSDHVNGLYARGNLRRL